MALSLLAQVFAACYELRLMAFVAILGLAGVGKTTLTRRLALALGGRAFCEPDRNEWPDFVENGFLDQAFDVMEWFRCYQVDLIRRAAEFGHSGYAICDSYYHKILNGYLDHDNSDWILPKEDPYFQVFKEVTRLDAKLLPNANKLIFVSANREDWKKMVTARNGQCDQILLDRAFPTQDAMEIAAREHASEHNIPLLHIPQKFGRLDDIVLECFNFIVRDYI